MRTKNSTYISVQLSDSEKAAMDEVVKRAGVPRNRWIRDLIAEAVRKATK